MSTILVASLAAGVFVSASHAQPIVSFFGVAEFSQLFAAEDPAADMTTDAIWNSFDVAAFLAAFSDGCP